MNWRSGLESVKWAANAVREEGTKLAGTTIEECWPTIQTVLRERVGPTCMAAASNDELIDHVAKTVHESLPLPIRLVIGPQQLTHWCLCNRDCVLAAATALTATDVSSEGRDAASDHAKQSAASE